MAKAGLDVEAQLVEPRVYQGSVAPGSGAGLGVQARGGEGHYPQH